jgi:hypothetical protein
LDPFLSYINQTNFQYLVEFFILLEHYEAIWASGENLSQEVERNSQNHRVKLLVLQLLVDDCCLSDTIMLVILFGFKLHL